MPWNGAAAAMAATAWNAYADPVLLATGAGYSTAVSQGGPSSANVLGSGKSQMMRLKLLKLLTAGPPAASKRPLPSVPMLKNTRAAMVGDWKVPLQEY